MAKKVVTQGGDKNLYKIEGSTTLEVYHVDVSPIFDKKIKIGSAKKLEDALSIIKSHSGNQIKEIKEW